MTRSLQGMGAGAVMLAAVGITALAINTSSSAQEQRAPAPKEALQAEGRYMQDPGTAPAMPRRPMQEPGMGDRMPMERPMMMAMGPATMIDDDDNLYILRGNQLFKVSKRNMQVTAEGHLPMPQMMGGRGEGHMERGSAPPPPSGGGGGRPK